MDYCQNLVKPLSLLSHTSAIRFQVISKFSCVLTSLKCSLHWLINQFVVEVLVVVAYYEIHCTFVDVSVSCQIRGKF